MAEMPLRAPRVTHENRAPMPGTVHLFLREEELRATQDLMFFAYREFTETADALLGDLRLGRAHHRVLHFVGRTPGITVGTLLGLLGITKQSLARVLNELLARGLVAQTAGASDRRQRLLSLTDAGTALERKLFEAQRDLLLGVFRDAGGPAVDGFRRVLTGIAGPDHGGRRGRVDGR